MQGRFVGWSCNQTQSITNFSNDHPPNHVSSHPPLVFVPHHVSSSSTVPAPAQGLAAKVLPLGLGSSANSWTTVPNTSAKYYSLTDAGVTLRPTRILGGSLDAPVDAPDGTEAIEVFVRVSQMIRTNQAHLVFELVGSLGREVLRLIRVYQEG